MSKIISVHSFMRGVGKSNLLANVAALLAQDGYRVGVVDVNFLAPSLHILFGLTEWTGGACLNDFIAGQCDITQAAYDLTNRLPPGARGRLWLVPSSFRLPAIAQILSEGYNAELLYSGFETLITGLGLDALLIEAHAGLNEDILISIAVCDTLALMMRPDKQDYQGTSVLIEVARRLQIPRTRLIVNQVPSLLDVADVKTRMQEAFNCPVIGALPYSDEWMSVGSAALFAMLCPHHWLTACLKQIAFSLMD